MMIERRRPGTELVGQLLHRQGAKREKPVHDVLSARRETQREGYIRLDPERIVGFFLAYPTSQSTLLRRRPRLL